MLSAMPGDRPPPRRALVVAHFGICVSDGAVVRGGASLRWRGRATRGWTWPTSRPVIRHRPGWVGLIAVWRLSRARRAPPAQPSVDVPRSSRTETAREASFM